VLRPNAQQPERRRIVELSHRITDGMATYPGLPAPRVALFVDHATSRPMYSGAAEFAIGGLDLVGNTGTYIDSPYQRYPDAADVSQLPLSRLTDLPTVVVDVRDQAELQRRLETVLPPRSLAGHAVLFRTGWSDRWGSDAYWQPGPYLADVVIQQLLHHRPAVVGVDSWNIDDPDDPSRPAHSRLLADGIPIVEHLCDLDGIPGHARCSFVPLAVEGAPSMPVRAFAVWQETRGR
jgi:kynurenine formamidase